MNNGTDANPTPDEQPKQSYKWTAKNGLETVPAKPIETDSVDGLDQLVRDACSVGPAGSKAEYRARLLAWSAQREAAARIDQERAAQASLVANRMYTPEFERMWLDSEARLKALRGEK